MAPRIGATSRSAGTPSRQSDSQASRAPEIRHVTQMVLRVSGFDGTGDVFEAMFPLQQGPAIFASWPF